MIEDNTPKESIADNEVLQQDNSTNQTDHTHNGNDVDENEAVINQLKVQLESEKDKFLRLFAEFENYKKRTSKERIELFKTANQEVIQALLPVVDDFERALQEMAKHQDDTTKTGIQLIYDKFNNTLKSQGLEVVALSTGDAFDADFAEAITQIPAPTADLKGKIVDVIEKGYKLGDKIIRFPKVVTGM